MTRNLTGSLSRAVLLSLLLLGVSACAIRTERPAPAPAAQTYAGDLPCADCPGIHVVLTLFPDGRYRLRQTYQERPAEFYEIGRWSRVQDDGERLRLSNHDGMREYRLVGPDRLRQLDREGREIESPFNYDLTRQATIEPVAGPMPLRGLFSLAGTTATLFECESGRNYALEPDQAGAFNALVRAYRADVTSGAQVLTQLRGRFEARAGADEFIRIESFERLAQGESCSAAGKTDTALQGTQWRAMTIRGEPVDAAARAPFFVLSAEQRVHGFAGCNRLLGDYVQTEQGLRFQSLASTRMTCPAIGLERRFLDALNATRAQRVEGASLALLDSDGSVVMRLEAVPSPAP